MNNLQSKARHQEAVCADQPVNFLDIRQIDIKPTVKALVGLCLFFGVMATTAALGALLVTLLKNLARLL